jgi:hypothetical protein
MRLHRDFYGVIPEDSANSKSPKVGGFRGQKPRSRADPWICVYTVGRIKEKPSLES